MRSSPLSAIPLIGTGPLRQLSIRLPIITALLLAVLTQPVAAHGVDGGDADFIQAIDGVHLMPYLYLGAKHMFTGYDHLLFLAGVIFFLHRLRDVTLYVTLFAIGHSLTLLIGVLGGIHANPWLIDALIGFSVVYKAFDNMGGLARLHWRLDARAAVFAFGLAHGFGLSTKLQDLSLSPDGLLANMLAFNIGVELGQLAALALMLLFFQHWRRSQSFARRAFVANAAIMCAGFILMGYQLTGYFAT